jgi:hypothetical protein
LGVMARTMAMPTGLLRASSRCREKILNEP